MFGSLQEINRNISNFTDSNVWNGSCNDIFSSSTNNNVTNALISGEISDATMNIIRKMFYCVLFPILFVFGFSGNILCLIVFCKDKFYSSTKLFLSILTLVDLCILFGGVFNTIMMIQQIFYPRLGQELFIRQAPYFSIFFAPLLYHIKIEITAVISSERLLAVFSPLHVKLFCTKRVLLVAVSILTALVIAISIPQMFVYDVDEIFKPCIGKILITRLTKFGQNRKLYQIYTVLVEALFLVIPFLVVFVSTTVIILTLSRRRRQYKTHLHISSERLENKERTITRTLVTMTTIFIICLTPMTILSMISICDPDNQQYRYQSNIYMLVSTVSYFLLNLNSAINFFVYMIFGSRYRKIFKSLFRRPAQENANIQNTSETPEMIAESFM